MQWTAGRGYELRALLRGEVDAIHASTQGVELVARGVGHDAAVGRARGDRARGCDEDDCGLLGRRSSRVRRRLQA
jgi:hypothetical protein